MKEISNEFGNERWRSFSKRNPAFDGSERKLRTLTRGVRKENLEKSRFKNGGGCGNGAIHRCPSTVQRAGAAKPRHTTPRRTHSRTASHATHNTPTNNVQASICSYREDHAVAIGKATARFAAGSRVVACARECTERRSSKRGDCFRTIRPPSTEQSTTKTNSRVSRRCLVAGSGE